jgi:hypothetical protein
MPTEEMPEILDQLEKIRADLEAKKKRDGWEILGLLSQFISAVVLGAVSLWVTTRLGELNAGFTKSQIEMTASSARIQTEMARQNRLLDYLKVIADASTDEKKRGVLITSAQLAIPDQAGVIAKYYAFNDASEIVRLAAIKALGAEHDKVTLEFIAANGEVREATEARVQLGEVIKDIRLRISDIDDIGTVYVNEQKLIDLQYQVDSGWHDLTSYFHEGDNNVTFKLVNGPYGGFSGRLQVNAGGTMYDSGRIGQNSCPCNAPAFEIQLTITVGKDKQIQKVSNAKITYF